MKKINKHKVYQLIGQTVVYSCLYVSSVVFCYWGLMQATVYR